MSSLDKTQKMIEITGLSVIEQFKFLASNTKIEECISSDIDRVFLCGNVSCSNCELVPKDENNCYGFTKEDYQNFIREFPEDFV